MGQNEKPLSGSVALVTGASRGIGKGIAIELAKVGATVYATARSTTENPNNPGTIGRTAREIEAEGGRAIPIACDHHDDAAVAAVFEQIEKDEGRLDILVNNATAEMASMVGKRSWELPFELWDDLIGVGLRSHYVASVHAARMMIPKRDGIIVNVSSHGSQQYLMGVIYGIGKAGVEKLTKDMSQELYEYGIAMISIWPGLSKSENRLAHAKREPDGRLTLHGLDLRLAETPNFPGRGVVALATDENRMERTGRAFWLADLAKDYGFTDLDGTIPDARKVDEYLEENAPAYWKDVMGTNVKLHRKK